MQGIVSQGRRTLSVHKEHEFLAKLEAAGLGDKEAQAVIQSKGNKMAGRIVTLIQKGEPGAQRVTVNVHNFDSAVGIWGEVMRIADPQGNVVAEATTGMGGDAQFDLEPGEYEIVFAAIFGDRKKIRIPSSERERHFSFGV